MITDNPFSLLLNILLRPSKWRATIADIDPELPPEFSLIELNRTHWRNPKMQRLLLSAYVGLPILLFGALFLGHLLLGLSIDGVIAALTFTLIIGFAVGLTISAAVGIAILAVVGASAALLWPDQRVLMFDMITSVRYAHLYGLSSALILIVITNCNRHTAPKRFLRQIGGVVLGLVASTIIMVGAVYLVLTIISARQTSNLPGNSVGIVLALLPTLLLGLATFLQSRSWQKALVLAVVTAVIFMLSFGRIGSEYGLEFGGNELLVGMNAVGLSMFLILTALPFSLTRRFVGAWPAAVAAAFGGLAVYIAYESIFSLFEFRNSLLLATGLIITGLVFGWIWSVAAYLFEAGWNTLIYRLDSQHEGPIRWLRYHATFWDELQRFPFFELDDYLVLAVERDLHAPREVPYCSAEQGRSHISKSRAGTELLGETTPNGGLRAAGSTNGEAASGAEMIRMVNQGQQQWAAQAARAELDARRLERIDSVQALASTSDDAAAGLLSTPAGLMLRNFAQLGGDVGAALTQPSPYNQRLVLSSVARDLENLRAELGRDSANRLAVRYKSVAHHWHNVVSAHIDKLDEATRANQQIPNPYIVGVPLTRRQEVFVGRTGVARYLEDILHQGDHPPMLLYGARRMGKTSLLYQLHWMLPRRILPLVVDLQGPVSLASNNVGFLHSFARGMRMAAARNEVVLPDLTMDELEKEPFTVFDEWINLVGQAVAEDGRDTVLLALDEFEALDQSLSTGVLEERAVLGMLRHIVQHRRGVKLLLSGSHTLQEFRRWSSYLINAQVVKLRYLTEEHTRQLIETPISDFPLRYEPDAVQHVLDLTRGHPYLVQLLCMEIVAHKNNHDQTLRHLATIDDVKATVPATLERGQQFFADIELNQIDEDGRLALVWLANQGPGYRATVNEFGAAIDESRVQDALQNLVRRDILEEADGQAWFQVELVRRWFDPS